MVQDDKIKTNKDLFYMSNVLPEPTFTIITVEVGNYSIIIVEIITDFYILYTVHFSMLIAAQFFILLF